MENIILPIHLLILGFVAITVLRADHMGFNWMRGSIQTLDEKEVKKYHYRIWFGLGLMILSGLFLFWPLREFLFTRPQFYVKMVFVATLIINGCIIGYLQKRISGKTFTSLSIKAKMPFLISGGISTLCWVLAGIAGWYLVPEY